MSVESESPNEIRLGRFLRLSRLMESWHSSAHSTKVSQNTKHIAERRIIKWRPVFSKMVKESIHLNMFHAERAVTRRGKLAGDRRSFPLNNRRQNKGWYGMGPKK